MTDSFHIETNLSGLLAQVDLMEKAVHTAARPAAQAAAQVLYDEVGRNVAKIGKKTGNLARAIYQAYSANNSGDGFATYHVSWNARKAPHGGLVEFGHLQRYATYLGKDGKWHTAVRPSMRGKPAPKRRASQAAKDAYYVPLATPRQVAAKPFVRPAASKFDVAIEAAKAELYRRIDNPT